ncbi:MAG: RagB/SusD family nutrient uptake outer membrane protein [Bacteroidales bacterium]|nr:RagB/SusD family nutrient uptake outer membrane protein [Bacteroidales bacterium]
MKSKYIYGLISCLFISFSSCDNMLDVELQGEYTNTTFYQTEEHAILAVNSTYELCAFVNTANNLWVFGDVASDDALKGGDAGDRSDITYINDFAVNPDNGEIESIWRHYYEGIVRANNVTSYVPDIDMDEELKQRIIAEAKFLRAYYYFHLSNIFGAIPLKTTTITSVEDLNIPVSSVETIYAQIEQDLTDASAALPVSYDSDDIGRATRGAALGLLAKVYLFQGEWQLALDNANAVEGLLIYDLMDVYSHNFNVLDKNNSESIFEIQHLEEQSPFLGSYLNQYFSPKPSGYSFNVPTQNYIDEFEITPVDSVYDPRLDYTVGRDGQDWVNGEPFDPTWSVTGYLQKKHVQPTSEVPIGDGNLNYTFMRYAEILLIQAEALNELNRGAEALIPLNEVRKRARECYLYDTELDGYTGTIPDQLLPDITNSNTSYLRTAIYHERRVELGFEFHRFYDLMRYGKNIAEQALSNTNFNYEDHRYFPIPQSEIDANSEI